MGADFDNRPKFSIAGVRLPRALAYGATLLASIVAKAGAQDEKDPAKPNDNKPPPFIIDTSGTDAAFDGLKGVAEILRKHLPDDKKAALDKLMNGAERLKDGKFKSEKERFKFIGEFIVALKDKSSVGLDSKFKKKLDRYLDKLMNRAEKADSEGRDIPADIDQRLVIVSKIERLAEKDQKKANQYLGELKKKKPEELERFEKLVDLNLKRYRLVE